MDMIREVRYYAANFMEEVARQEILGGWQRGEEHAQRLAKTEIRKHIIILIMKVKQCEVGATEALGKVLKNL